MWALKNLGENTTLSIRNKNDPDDLLQLILIQLQPLLIKLQKDVLKLVTKKFRFKLTYISNAVIKIKKFIQQTERIVETLAKTLRSLINL